MHGQMLHQSNIFEGVLTTQVFSVVPNFYQNQIQLCVFFEYDFKHFNHALKHALKTFCLKRR